MSDSVDKYMAHKNEVLHCVLCDTVFGPRSWGLVQVKGRLGQTPAGEIKHVCPTCAGKLRGVLDIHTIAPAPFWDSLTEVLKDADLPTLYSDMVRAYDNYDCPIAPNSTEIHEGFNEQGLAAIELFRSRFDYKHFLELYRDWHWSDTYLRHRAVEAKTEAQSRLDALK